MTWNHSEEELAVTCALALLGTLLVVPKSAGAASPATGSLTFPINNISGTCTAAGVSLCTAAGQTLSFTGTGTVTGFSAVNGVLTAAGSSAGTLTNTATGASQAVSGTFSAPAAATGSCPILNLTIGPINLDLLGLVVQTNTIHLQITAQRGPGNLLGNLLCAVTHLLDSNASTTALANLLNQILSAL